MDDNRDKGYIKVYRSFFRHALWREQRTFSRAEAWLDIFASANHTPGQEIVGDTPVEIDRGEFRASVRFLAKRWSWSKSTVARFLALLKAEGMIDLRVVPDTRQAIIVVLNYETYNAHSLSPILPPDTKWDIARDTICENDGTPCGTPYAEASSCAQSDCKDGQKMAGHLVGHLSEDGRDTNRDIKWDKEKERYKERENNNTHIDFKIGYTLNARTHECDRAGARTSAPPASGDEAGRLTQVRPADERYLPDARALLEWIASNASHLNSMAEPLNLAEAVEVMKRYGAFGKEDIGRVLLNLNNRAGIEQTERNTYASFRKWAGLDHQMNSKRAALRQAAEQRATKERLDAQLRAMATMDLLQDNRRYNALHRQAIGRGEMMRKPETVDELRAL